MSDGSFNALLAIVKAHRFQEPKSARALAELALFVGMTLGGVAVFLLSDNLPVQLGGLFVSTCGSLGMSTLAHTASHYAAVGGKRLNRFLTYLGYPFFFGVSATYWWNKHCVVHHPTPNLIGIDDDIDLSPFFAITEDQFHKGPLRRFHSLQWLFVPIALAINEFNVQRSGWVFLAGKLRDPGARTAAHWLDLATLAAHWGTWLFLPMLFIAPLEAAGLYVVRMVLMGYAMFIAFAPAHFPEEAVAAEADQKTTDFLLRQTATTVNFRTGRFGALLCNGVEYQIEHHLFPWISPYHYPELSKIVSAFCRQHGYPYRTLGWWEGVWKSLVVFYRPKPVLPRLEECKDDPTAPQRTEVPAVATAAAPAVPLDAAPETRAVTTSREP